MMTYDIDLECVPRRTFAAVRFHATADDMAAKIGPAFGTVAEHLARHGVMPQGPAVARYEHAADGFDVSAGFYVTEPVDGDGEVELCDLPDCEVVHTTHLGGYEDLPAAYDAVHEGAAALGRTVDDGAMMWEEYWSDETAPPEETRTDIYWPLVTA